MVRDLYQPTNILNSTLILCPLPKPTVGALSKNAKSKIKHNLTHRHVLYTMTFGVHTVHGDALSNIVVLLIKRLDIRMVNYGN